MNNDIVTVMNWAERWLVSFNPAKTESLLISRRRNPPIHPDLLMSGQNIQLLLLINILECFYQTTVHGILT